MDVTTLIFLTSGLFLGWSLGANDAANVFGTAVGSRMIRFTTAALICSVFVVLGAVFAGAGAAHGLGKLGAVNALAGSFVVASAAGLTVYWMTKAKLPVSTTQAIVGAIIGWNVFSGSRTDPGTLTKIVATWVACPVLAGLFSAGLYSLVVRLIYRSKIHLLRLDLYTRICLVLAGAFGAYSLGANNIGNVMGVFVASSPFTDVSVAGALSFTSVQQLFLLGALAIGVGVFTYSKRVMLTVGSTLMPLNPVAACVVVVSHSLVLFLFSSTALEHLLLSAGLPAIPLIPVSSSQAVIGAVIGIGLLRGKRGARQIRWSVLGKIAAGWVSTPLVAGVVCLFLLFVVQNVFDKHVYKQAHFQLSPEALDHLEEAGIPTAELAELKDREFAGGAKFRDALRRQVRLDGEQEALVVAAAEVHRLHIDPERCDELNTRLLSAEQIAALRALAGQSFIHKWQLERALTEQTDAWRKRDASKLNKAFNKALHAQLEYVYRTFHVPRE